MNIQLRHLHLLIQNIMMLQLRHTSFITQSLKEIHSGRETGLIDTGPLKISYYHTVLTFVLRGKRPFLRVSTTYILINKYNFF